MHAPCPRPYPLTCALDTTGALPSLSPLWRVVSLRYLRCPSHGITSILLLRPPAGLGGLGDHLKKWRRCVCKNCKKSAIGHPFDATRSRSTRCHVHDSKQSEMFLRERWARRKKGCSIPDYNHPRLQRVSVEEGGSEMSGQVLKATSHHHAEL